MKSLHDLNMLFQCNFTKDSREGQTRGTGQKRMGEGFPYYFHYLTLIVGEKCGLLTTHNYQITIISFL